MVIKFYGTRGSLPVASKGTKKYGGNTTCLYVESNAGDAIVVDAGSGIRELGAHLLENKKLVIHLIFTHYHWDHIQGLPFFAPIYLKKSVITIYGPKKEATAKQALSHQMSKPYFPTVSWSDVPSKIKYKELSNNIKIGDIRIQTIANNHPNYTIGLKFTEKKNCFAFLTDNELLVENGNTPYKKFVEFVRGVNFFVHDAAYTDEIYQKKIGWGHSTFSQVMQLAKDAGVKNVIFTHHDPPNTDKFIDDVLQNLRSEHPDKNIQAAADGKTIILK